MNCLDRNIFRLRIFYIVILNFYFVVNVSRLHGFEEKYCLEHHADTITHA